MDCVSTVVKTKTGSWVRTLLTSGGLVWGVCPYTDTVTDTSPVPGGWGPRVNRASQMSPLGLCEIVELVASKS